ncbi:MAG: ribonuclease III [Bacteroidetes bacterium]|nr:ribonuclease III [Bacteroidota bacterium]
MIDRPSNALSRLIFRKKSPQTIRQLVRLEFGVRIRKREYYDEALTHSSMLDGDTTGLRSNERLEFLGDTALDLVVASFLYQSFPDEQEGGLTQRKSKMVNRETLNLVGTNMELRRFIRTKMRKTDVHSTVVGNALEALIGAIYLDHGYQKTSRAVMRMLKRHGADDKVHETVDFKSKLHHWAQREKASLSFEVVREYHVKGKTRYDVEALIEGVKRGSGTGSSKKSAEQRSARGAWRTVFESSKSPSQGEELDPSERPDVPETKSARKSGRSNNRRRRSPNSSESSQKQ